jgi:hypothetical protein
MIALLVFVLGCAVGYLAAKALTHAAAYRRRDRWPAYTPEGPR